MQSKKTSKEKFYYKNLRIEMESVEKALSLQGQQRGETDIRAQEKVAKGSESRQTLSQIKKVFWKPFKDLLQEAWLVGYLGRCSAS